MQLNNGVNNYGKTTRLVALTYIELYAVVARPVNFVALQRRQSAEYNVAFLHRTVPRM